MSRRKKANKSEKNKRLPSEPIQFEIEEDAEELLLRHLEEFKPQPKDADSLGSSPKSSKRASAVRVIDLHGMLLADAEKYLKRELEELMQQNGLVKIKVVTGKGRHSQGREGVLIKEMHGFVMRNFSEHIVSIEESPDKLRISGEPIRGHFHVSLRGAKD